MDPQRRQQYLAAMGIRSWVPRAPSDAPVEDGPADAPVPQQLPADPPPAATSQLPTSKTSSVPGPTPAVQRQAPVANAAAIQEVPPAWLDDIPPPADEFIAGNEAPPDAQFALEDDNGVAQLDWDGLRHRVAQCDACELHKSRTQTVFGVGDVTADVMVIGEAPGAEEDRQGEPFVGPAGSLLNAMLEAVGLNRQRVFIANILKCRPPGNRDPHADEIEHCQGYLKRQVALVNPRVILAVGRVSAQSLLQTAEPVGRLRGKPASFEQVPVVVTYHPAYLLRSPLEKSKAWRDLQRLARQLRG